LLWVESSLSGLTLIGAPTQIPSQRLLATDISLSLCMLGVAFVYYLRQTEAAGLGD